MKCYPAWVRRACALRTQGICWQTVPHSGERKDFWRVNRFYFYENGLVSGTKSGVLLQNRIFGPKAELLGQKKEQLD